MTYGRFAPATPPAPSYRAPTGEGRFSPTWDRPAPTITGTSIAGPNYVDYQGQMISMGVIDAFLATPQGRLWAGSGAMGTPRATGYTKTGEQTIQYVGGDWRPVTQWSREQGLAPPIGGIATPRYGAPTTRYGVAGGPADWYPPMRWGRPIEEVTEYARPTYDPAWQEMLGEARGAVSPTRYEWMERQRADLLRQWQASLPVSEVEFGREPYKAEYEVAPITSEELMTRVRELTKTGTIEEAEEQAQAWAQKELQRRAMTAEETARGEAIDLAKVAAQQRQAEWGAWAGAYPFEEDWYQMGRRERGLYPAQYSPATRWNM